ncbi:hypothetical protein ABG067_009539, partial [Albugo candida]
MTAEDIKEKIEVIDIVNEKKSGLDKDHSASSSDENSSIYSSDGSEIITEGYIHDLQWTPEEERAV